MSITQKIEKYHKNRIESIKKMKNGIDKDMAIGSLVADLGKGSIKPVANAIGSCFRTVKNKYLSFVNRSDYIQLSLEFRGRKKAEDKDHKLIDRIKQIVYKYENTDSHFKTEKLYIDLNPKTLRLELINTFDEYTDNNCPCENTLKRIIKDLGYKLRRVTKSLVIEKIPETDAIFENVFETIKAVEHSNDTVVAISIDDKNAKKIGLLSDNGKSYIERKALDHDTIYNCSVKPFGILDMKTNETFVYCTTSNSTAQYKVDCIEKYVQYKLEKINLKKLVIFLDNGPENSSRRKLWIKCLYELSIKYDIVIELVYYPPYHSKYNKIERYWARLQMSWSGLIIDTLDKLITTIKRVTWKDINTKAYLNTEEYQKGIEVSKKEFNKIEKNYISREKGIEKWSLVITPSKIKG